VTARVAGSYGPAGLSGPRCRVEGRLEGVDSLAADLGLAGHAAEEVLGAAFTRLRERLLDRLDGSFALLVWDEAAGEGLLAVDRLGSGGLFFHEGGGSCLRFATEPADLLALLPATPGADEHALARWLGFGALDPGQTLYAGIRRLPGGCCLRLAGGRWSELRYWRPRFAAPAPATLAEAGAAAREALEDAVARRSSGARAAVLLSGGLDSSSVAAAARFSARGPASLSAFSATFPSQPSVDESRFAELAAGSLELPARRIEPPRAGVLDAASDHVAEWRLPPASPNVFFQRPLLRAARAEGAEVLLDGQGGDELFGCSPYLLADRLRALRVTSARGLARELTGGDARLVRHALSRYGLAGALPRQALATASRLRGRPQAPWWLTERAAGLAGELPGRYPWLRLDGPRWWSWLADLLTAGRERMGVHDHLRRKLASEGLRGGHPLLDDTRLVELVLSLPPELAFDRSLDRPVLREAMRGLMPDEIRLRSTKSYFDRLLVDALSGPELPRLADILGRPDAELRGYIRAERLRDVVNGPRSDEHPQSWARNAWRLASTELWLRSLARQPAAVTA
jgi:asparagine synthase (glutamine-hydrolysing)